MKDKHGMKNWNYQLFPARTILILFSGKFVRSRQLDNQPFRGGELLVAEHVWRVETSKKFLVLARKWKQLLQQIVNTDPGAVIDWAIGLSALFRINFLSFFIIKPKPINRVEKYFITISKPWFFFQCLE